MEEKSTATHLNTPLIYFAVYARPIDRAPIAIFANYPDAQNWRNSFCKDGTIEELANEFFP